MESKSTKSADSVGHYSIHRVNSQDMLITLIDKPGKSPNQYLGHVIRYSLKETSNILTKHQALLTKKYQYPNITLNLQHNDHGPEYMEAS